MNRFVRLTCLVLALSLLFCCTSCYGAEKEAAYNKDIKFEVKQHSIKYSDDFLEKSCDIFTAFAVKLIEDYYSTKLKDSDISRVRAEYKKTFIPAFLRARIYENELKTIIYALEHMTGEKENASPDVIFDIYNELILAVGSAKAGAVAFELVKAFVDYKRQQAYADYEKYGYSWYLEDAKRHEETYNSLCNMGKEKLGQILAVGAILASGTHYTFEGGNNSAFELTGSDFLFVLEYHGQSLADLNITEAEARTFGTLFEELIPNNAQSPTASHMYALKKDGYFVEAARIIPHFARLYAHVTKALSKNGKLDFNGSGDAAALSVSRALVECEAELNLFLEAAECLSTRSENELASIKEQGLIGELDAFLESGLMLDADGLVSALKEIAAADESGAGEGLVRVIRAYAKDTAPYLLFTLTR